MPQTSLARRRLMSTESLRATIRDLMPRAKADLATMVSFKSVHDAKQFPPAECQAMVDFVVERFAELGLRDVQGHETPDGSKAVCGHKPGPPGSPTVLLYFHHDYSLPSTMLRGRRRCGTSPRRTAAGMAAEPPTARAISPCTSPRWGRSVTTCPSASRSSARAPKNKAPAV